MLSKHPEACRFPHGHSRRIEVVVSSERLDRSDMVVDFKLLRMALEDLIQRFDHSMAINSADPFRDRLIGSFPQAVVEFEGLDPTTEVLARYLFDQVERVFSQGYAKATDSGTLYEVAPHSVTVDRVRVWETATSWAEYGE